MNKEKKCKNCSEKKCSTCAECQAKAFELEVDEEIQQERLTKFWKKYAWLIYGIIFLILAAVLGFESYHAWRVKTRLAESDLFEKSALLANNNYTQKAAAGFEELSKNGKTGYRVLAQFELADIWVKEGQKEKALELLQTTINSTSETDPLHQVAILSFVSYQLDEGNPEKLLEKLHPVLNDPHFQGLGTELAVLLLKKQNKFDEAKKLIQKALSNPNTTPAVKTRLSTLIGE